MTDPISVLLIKHEAIIVPTVIAAVLLFFGAWWLWPEPPFRALLITQGEVIGPLIGKPLSKYRGDSADPMHDKFFRQMDALEAICTPVAASRGLNIIAYDFSATDELARLRTARQVAQLNQSMIFVVGRGYEPNPFRYDIERAARCVAADDRHDFHE